MDQLLASLFGDLSIWILLLIIAAALFVLGKSAEVLVEQAVALSLHWGVPKIIIGATIISLGTTLPEASVSVLAAINGQSDMALGNGLGSIITNLGLILGLAALIGTVPVDRKLASRQGWYMVFSCILLVVVSIPVFSRSSGGWIAQPAGYLLVILLILYIVYSIRSSRKENGVLVPLPDPGTANENRSSSFSYLPVIAKLLISLVLIIASSKILISAVEVTAARIGIPQSIIAAILVAFGTSLPELIMSVTAVRKGHGELALGNVIGANILNVLFVIGTSAAVTGSGLIVPDSYYYLHFPVLLFMFIIFRLAVGRKHSKIPRLYGFVLTGTYFAYLAANYLLPH